MVDSPLNHPLKTEGLLQHILVILGYALNFFLEEGLERKLEAFDITTTIFYYFNAIAVVQNGKKHMFNTDVFVPSLFGLSHRKSEGSAQFLTNHDLNLSPWHT